LEAEVAAEVVVEGVVNGPAVKVEARLERVVAPDFTEVIGQLIHILDTGLGPVGAEPKCKERRGHDRQGSRCRILRRNPGETVGCGIDWVDWCHGGEVKAGISNTELVQDRR